MDKEKSNVIKNMEHHKQHSLCTTRPAYRQGRKLTAVKAYTISSESNHVFVYGVPAIKLRSEMKKLCSKYGKVLSLHCVEGLEQEPFTECYHIQYHRLQSARVAKRLMDNRSFYGGLLHVCYAPEYETIEETREKLMRRTIDVQRRLSTKIIAENQQPQNFSAANNYQQEIFSVAEHEDQQEQLRPLAVHTGQHTSSSGNRQVECTDASIIQIATSSAIRKRPYQIPSAYLKGPASHCTEVTPSPLDDVAYKKTKFIPHQLDRSGSKKIIFRKNIQKVKDITQSKS